jgi:cytochrome c553
MKKVIFVALVASVSLMAAESAATEVDGATRYMQKCSICHGPKADKTPIKNMKPIAGMDAQKVARILVNYQNDASQDDQRIAHGYSQEMVNSTVYLSRKDIDNIAKYVSSLKK